MSTNFVRFVLGILLAFAMAFTGCDNPRRRGRAKPTEPALSGYEASGVYKDSVNPLDPYRSVAKLNRRCIDGGKIPATHTKCNEDIILSGKSHNEWLVGTLSGKERLEALTEIAEDAQYMLEHSKDQAAIAYAHRIGAEAARQLEELNAAHGGAQNDGETAARLEKARTVAEKMLREGQVGDDW